MYMGVILVVKDLPYRKRRAPHVYGGDPTALRCLNFRQVVLPMYMGVIL